ncbi:MAG: hypothetical protein DDT27_00975 [Dehalococcoidia bacterium]|nr:hypothetical protein [Chloroflexota bacterium]MBT9160515.1 hypothetical protein [Chloroflexota bacterium]MBT9162417.1 hypothetical protein [Chloroflexota bacterium]
MVLPEPTRITQLVANILDRLQIPYFVGGSLASSLHGIPRATQDADIVADIKSEHIVPFVEALRTQFYVDEQMIRDAIERRSSFNVIHLETMFKVDVFVFRNELGREAMARRERYQLSDQSASYIFLATAEDIILSKLQWFRLGEGTSERQWLDVLGVLQVQGDRLDFPYLQRMAGQMGVHDLLRQAIEDAAIDTRDN